MSALLLHITGLLCGTLMSYTSAQYSRSFRDGCDLLWEENNATHVCYQFNLQSALSWQEAHQSCEDQGGDLLSITNLAEHNYISEKLKNKDAVLWIGLIKLDGLSGWQWSDGAALAFLNWRNSTPWYHERSRCATYDAGGGHKWRSSDCATKLPYACKKYLTPRQPDLYEETWKFPPTQCKSNGVHHNHTCSKLQREALPWSEASAACRSDGGELMSVNSLADVEFLMNLLDRESVSEAWIGMNASHGDPVEFQWSDGSAMTLTSWQNHEPNISLGGDDLCVSAHYADGNWRVRPCSRKLFSVCKFKKPGLPETTEDAHLQCEENWVRHGYHCYGIKLQFQSFLTAVGDSNCPLATITNRFEQAFINSLIASEIIPGNAYYWIALQDINRTEEYTWLATGNKHRPLTFTYWDTKEPGYNGGCVVLSSKLNKGYWKVNSCTGFPANSLCKKSIISNVWRESNPHEGNIDQACAPSWDTEPHLHHCYRVFHHEKLMRKRTWQEAEDLCQEFGANLSSLSTTEEKIFIRELVSSMFKRSRFRTFWIGLNKLNPSSGDSWQWSDGSPVVSSFRVRSNPSDVSSNCVAYSGRRWFEAFKCDAHLDWICKIPKGVAPKTPDWHIKDAPCVFYQGYNYCFYDINAGFDSAEFICSWMQSEVTSILNRHEQAFIHKRIKQMSKENQKWWIGLVNEHEEFQSWEDGSPVEYTNWETDPLSDTNSSITVGAKQCAYIESQTGRWRYSDCLSENPAICKSNVTFKIEKHYGPVDSDDDQEYGICPNGWLYYANKCFFVYKDGNMSDWYAAHDFCRKRGTGLATITNEIEQVFIVLQLYGEMKGFWIGPTKNDYELWENGTVEAYNNWAPTRYTYNPYNQDRLCALISANQNVHPTGKWYLEKCNAKGYGFICEKEDITGPDMFPVSETMEYGDKEYGIISGNMSWYDASIVCQKQKSKLASITDPYHQAFLTILARHLGYPLWIGYYSTETF